jgi:hypothetical protein
MRFIGLFNLMFVGFALTAISSRAADLANFCDVTSRYGQSEWAFKLSEPELQAKIHARDASFLNSATAWQGSTYPDEWVRLENHNGAFASGLPRGTDPKIEANSILKFLKGLPSTDTYSWSLRAEQDFLQFRTWGSTDANRTQSTELDTLVKVAPLLCADQGSLIDAPSCVKAVKKVAQIFRPVSERSLFDLLKKILRDHRYAAASVKLAITIESKIQVGGIPQGDLLTDAIEATRAAGFGTASEDAAFDLLAFYSTDGPNSAMYIQTWISRENAGLYYGTAVLGTGITVLNARSERSSHQYAYPPQVAARCDNGKPYHFWMAAYLARFITQQMGHPSAVRTAVYITSVGYQMLSKTNGRDPARAFKISSTAPENQKIRMDLAVAAAGAEFGAYEKSAKIISIDRSLENLLSHAGKISGIDDQSAETLWSGTGIAGYHRWMQIFNPTQAMASFPSF